MLIEINLLPEKEKRNVTNVLILLIIGLLLIAGLQFLFMSYQSAQDELLEIEQEFNDITTEREMLNQQLTGGMQSDFDHLLKTVEKLEEYKVPASSILSELVRALPERGFFSSYSYTYSGKIELNAYFDIIDDVAQYTNALLILEEVESVKVNSIETYKRLEDEIDFQFHGYLPRYLATFEIELADLEGES